MASGKIKFGYIDSAFEADRLADVIRVITLFKQDVCDDDYRLSKFNSIEALSWYAQYNLKKEAQDKSHVFSKTCLDPEQCPELEEFLKYLDRRETEKKAGEKKIRDNKTGNFGIYNSNLAAWVSNWRHMGLFDSTRNVMRLSELAEKTLVKGNISFASYVFIFLMKQWICVGEKPKRHLLAAVYESILGDESFLSCFDRCGSESKSLKKTKLDEIRRCNSYVRTKLVSTLGISKPQKYEIANFRIDLIKAAMVDSGLLEKKGNSLVVTENARSVLQNIKDYERFIPKNVSEEAYYAAFDNGIIGLLKQNFSYEVYQMKYQDIIALVKADPITRIYFGAPGTGKSYKIDHGLINGKGLKDWDLDEGQVWRTTFHPDYDYSQFVGYYKPVSKDVEGDTGSQPIDDKSADKKTEISYEFSPQVFANAYVHAWGYYLDWYVAHEGDDGTVTCEDMKKVYLVIEEINRGNCALIFGDIFQLLDRGKSNFSQYAVDCDDEFCKFIKKTLNKWDNKYWEKYKSVINNLEQKKPSGKKVVGFSKVVLPPNFNILATMNTSDQSLFPMDSAFKRRFDWEYVPIKSNVGDSSRMRIRIGNEYFSWTNFLIKINKSIKEVTESDDKTMGEFFVNPVDHVVSQSQFCSKILHHLWDSVYKNSIEEPKDKLFRAQESDELGKLMFSSFFDDVSGDVDSNIVSSFLKCRVGLSKETLCFIGESEDVVIKTFDEFTKRCKIANANDLTALKNCFDSGEKVFDEWNRLEEKFKSSIKSTLKSNEVCGLFILDEAVE